MAKSNYGRPSMSPPPAPRRAPPTHEVSSDGLVASASLTAEKNPGNLLLMAARKYEQTKSISSASLRSAMESSIKKINSMNNYKRPARSPPPAPRRAPPTHEVSGDGLLAASASPTIKKSSGNLPLMETSKYGQTTRISSASFPSAMENSNKKTNNLNNYKAPARSPPPSPQQAPPTHPVSGDGLLAASASPTSEKSSGNLPLMETSKYGQTTSTSSALFPCAMENSNKKTSNLNNYKAPSRSPPPAPRRAPPTHEVSGNGLVASVLSRLDLPLVLSA